MIKKKDPLSSTKRKPCFGSWLMKSVSHYVGFFFLQVKEARFSMIGRATTVNILSNLFNKMQLVCMRICMSFLLL